MELVRALRQTRPEGCHTDCVPRCSQFTGSDAPSSVDMASAFHQFRLPRHLWPLPALVPSYSGEVRPFFPLCQVSTVLTWVTLTNHDGSAVEVRVSFLCNQLGETLNCQRTWECLFDGTLCGVGLKGNPKQHQPSLGIPAIWAFRSESQQRPRHGLASAGVGAGICLTGGAPSFARW